jgi:hypothetical protein
MHSSHHPRPWSLRPEELLIESARDRLLRQEAIADAAAPDTYVDDPCPIVSPPIRRWLCVMSAKRVRLRAPLRRLNVTVATTPNTPERSLQNEVRTIPAA